MSAVIVASCSVIYLLLLFGIAYWVEQRKRKGGSFNGGSWMYALSLAVYCTGWTYYGSVGRAVSNGPEFLTIYLGPSIMCALFVPFLQKILRICKTQRISSIADFISTRYGKRFSLGALVTVCCIIGVIPYIALQLKAISSSFQVMTHHADTGDWHDSTFFIAGILSLFIIIFGTRSVDASERHEGLVAAIAFESLVKLLAFIAAGVFVTWFLFDGFTDVFSRAKEAGLEQLFVLSGPQAHSNWLTMILVSMLSMVFLPRQFQVSIVENTDQRHLFRAVWLFPIYLFVINIFVWPIAIGGKLLLGSGVHADNYVLALPLHFDRDFLGMAVYIGGLSAASSMIIVETIALATMVSNHLVLPILFSGGVNKDHSAVRRVTLTRRASIVLILLLACIYDRLIGPAFSLVSIGVVSMAAVAQFAPAVVGGLYSRLITRQGAMVAIIMGFLVWFYTLILPSFTDAGYIDPQLMTLGPWGIAWLKPQALFGITGMDVLAHSFFWSMLVNVLSLLVVSLLTRPDRQEEYQAELFVNIFKYGKSAEERIRWKASAPMTEVRSLLSGFLGQERAGNLLQAYAHRHRIALDDKEADPRMIGFAEKVLTGVIGSASARFLVGNIAKEEEISINEVLTIVRESQQVLELNKELKKKSLELSRAKEMLTGVNDQLRQMDALKDEFLYTVTHELRTPLTSIRALSEILYDHPDMEEEQRQDYLEGIVREIERLSYLITQVLNLEKYESGRQKLDYRSVDMNSLCTEVLAALAPLYGQKQVVVGFETPAPLLLIDCDRDLIRQVLYNLVSNAIKFVPDAGGKIVVALQLSVDELKVSVTDNGRGIEPELRELIFDKFFQARNQTLQKPSGSGLGLAICKKIVEMHGGSIYVEQVMPEGAHFVFTLPLR